MARFEGLVAGRPGRFVHSLHINSRYCIVIQRDWYDFVDELGGEIFDMLTSLGDFMEFKDLILNYKRMRAGADCLELSGRHVDESS